MKLAGILVFVMLFGTACLVQRDGLREGRSDIWIGTRYGFELTLPGGTCFETTSLHPYRLVVREAQSGLKANIEVHEAEGNGSEILDSYIALIPKAQILSRGQLMFFGRPGALAHLLSSQGRSLLGIIRLRKDYCLIRIESTAETGEDIVLRFWDSLLTGLRFT